MNSDEPRSFLTNQGNAAKAALLAMFAILGNALVLANPGFYSHDEWQKVDAIHTYGFIAYVRAYGRFIAGPEFGFPVRPLGFIQQGISALFMRDAPVIVHGLDIVTHIAIVIVLWRVLLEWGCGRRHSFWISAIFAVSPLTAFSVGWVGASFDRWYTLFCLLGTLGFVDGMKRGIHLRNGALMMAGSALAIASKETAIMFPVLIAGLWWMRRRMSQPVPVSTLLLGLILVSVPILSYLFVRLPALQASFSGKTSTHAYAPSLSNVFDNFSLYFSQPFLFGTSDLDSAAFLPKWDWYVALGLHLCILVTLVVRHGFVSSIYYLCGYFLFLIPVLAIGTHGAHYLYASAIPFSIAVIYAFTGQNETSAVSYRLTVSLGLLAAILMARTLQIEWGMYGHGVCQSRFLATLDAQIQSGLGRTGNKIDLYTEFGAPGYIARSAVFGRSIYDGTKGPNILIHDGKLGESDHDSAVMTPSCEVVRP